MPGNVFAAIDFDPETIDGLEHYRDILLEHAPRLRITRPETWHATLVFLGPLTDEEPAIRIMEEVPFKPFPLVLGGFGTFGRGSRRILWVGVERNPELIDYQRRLSLAFEEAGFPLEERAYTPHITFSRHWNPKASLDLDLLRSEVQPITTKVEHPVLLRSESDHGIPYHEELFRK